MKRFFLHICAVLLMLTALTACGSVDYSGSPYLGVWTGIEYNVEGEHGIAGETEGEFPTLELKADGKGRLAWEGRSCTIKWTEAESGGIEMESGGDVFTAALAGDVLEMEFDGAEFSFIRGTGAQ